MDKATVNQRFISIVNYLVNNNTIKSRTELAERLNVKFNKLSEILNGRAGVGIDMIISFCEMFGVHYEYLLTGRGAVYRTENDSKGEINPESVIDYLILNTEKLLQHRKFKVWYDNIYTKGALDSLKENVKAKYNTPGD
jgi:plasmid maintenance system antidote protein VapI